MEATNSKMFRWQDYGNDIFISSADNLRASLKIVTSARKSREYYRAKQKKLKLIEDGRSN